MTTIASATDVTKLSLSQSVKERRNACSGPPPVYPDLSTCHDWPVKKPLSIRLKGNSKRTSGNSLSPLGPRRCFTDVTIRG